MLTAAELQFSCDSPRGYELSGGPSSWKQDQIVLRGKKKERKHTEQTFSPKNCKDSPANVTPYISQAPEHKYKALQI